MIDRLSHMRLNFVTITAHHMHSPLERDQLRGGIPGFFTRHFLDELNGARRVVLFLICLADQVLEALGPSLHSSDGNILIADEFASMRVLEKCPPPTARFHTPGTHEHASLHYNSPNADDAVHGLPARPDAKDLLFADHLQNLRLEAIL